MGAHAHLTRGSNGLSPEIKYKCSKNVFAITSIVLTVVRLCSELLQLSAQSLIGSPGTLGWYLYGACPRTVLILIEVEFIVPEL